MARLVVEPGALVLRLSRREKAGALHGDIRVSLSSVRDVRALDRPWSVIKGLRAPGTGIPWVIALGTFRYRGGKDFLAVYRGRGLVVELEGTPFKRLVLTTPDPEGMRDEVLAALPSPPAAPGA